MLACMFTVKAHSVVIYILLMMKSEMRRQVKVGATLASSHMTFSFLSHSHPIVHHEV